MDSAADRGTLRAGFLAAHGWGATTPTPLAGDASFRRYYRLRRPGAAAVLMDAPPPHERVRPFVKVAGALRGLRLSAPEIYAEDRASGFLLIEDFGDDTYTRRLGDGGDEAALYALAVDTLIALHRRAAERGVPRLPAYSPARLLREAALLTDWYMPAVLGRRPPAAIRREYLDLWRRLLPLADLPAATLVLRDYHVDNLVLLPGREGVEACGLLDFQDAVIGPASYDLASLIEDARRDVPVALQAAMTERYLAAFPDLDAAAFRRSAAVLAAQRNCKIIGIFTRLAHRDGKPHYLGHIPRVWRLVEQDVREPALAPLADWLERHLPPALRLVPQATMS